MRAGDRIVAWTRVAPSFLPRFAVVTFPLRPPATHQAPNMLCRPWSFTPRQRACALSRRASSDGLTGMLAIRAMVGRALLPPGLANATTRLGC